MHRYRISFVVALCVLVTCAYTLTTELSQSAPSPEQVDSDQLYGTNAFLAFSRAVDPHLPRKGLIIAQYSLKVRNADDQFERILIAYDVEKRHWFKCRTQDPLVCGFGPLHSAIQGLAAERYLIREGRPGGFPLDDTAVEAFLPFVFLSGVKEYLSSFVSAEKTHEGGLECKIELPNGRRKQYSEGVPVTPRLVTFRLDTAGRMTRMWTDSWSVDYTYSELSPGEIALADPAHGGNWRLEWFKVHPESPQDFFGDESLIRLMREHSYLRTEDEIRAYIHSRADQLERRAAASKTEPDEKASQEKNP